MSIKLNTLLQVRRADFTAHGTFVLQAGEPGFCTATKVFKIGDGTTTWAELDFANRSQINTILATYYTKNEVDAAHETMNGAIEAAQSTADGAASGLSTLSGTVNGQAQQIAALQTHTAVGSNLTVKGYVDQQVGSEATARGNADEALGERITEVETKLSTVSNVMDFIGQRTVTVDEETGVITVTPVDGETFHKGDVVVDGAGKEYVYDGTVWAEFGNTSASETAIAALQTRMGTAEGEIDQLQTTVNTIQTTTIPANIQRLEKYTDDAKAELLGDSEDTQSEMTLYGIRLYAKTEAGLAGDAAKLIAKNYTDNQVTELIGDSEDAQTEMTLYGVKAFARSEAAAQGGAAQSAAKAYTDTQITGLSGLVDDKVAGIVAGTSNDVISVTTDETAGKTVTVSHKDYTTGTLKDAAHDSATDPSFLTGVVIENGHVTNATVRNLAEVLAAMEFILDGGTAE